MKHTGHRAIDFPLTVPEQRPHYFHVISLQKYTAAIQSLPFMSGYDMLSGLSQGLKQSGKLILQLNIPYSSSGAEAA